MKSLNATNARGRERPLPQEVRTSAETHPPPEWQLTKKASLGMLAFLILPS